MRLARLVAAGLVFGGVAGFVTALVHRRSTPVMAASAIASSVGTAPVTSGGPAGAGSDLPTRPFPLPIEPAMAGTGGSC